jgi:hypothetical protein
MSPPVADTLHASVAADVSRRILPALKTAPANGRVAQAVRACEGRARCPQRAVEGRPNPHVSNIFGRSRRAGDSAPYPRTGWATRPDVGGYALSATRTACKSSRLLWRACRSDSWELGSPHGPFPLTLTLRERAGVRGNRPPFLLARSTVPTQPTAAPTAARKLLNAQYLIIPNPPHEDLT